MRRRRGRNRLLRARTPFGSDRLTPRGMHPSSSILGRGGGRGARAHTLLQTFMLACILRVGDDVWGVVATFVQDVRPLLATNARLRRVLGRWHVHGTVVAPLVLGSALRPRAGAAPPGTRPHARAVPLPDPLSGDPLGPSGGRGPAPSLAVGRAAGGWAPAGAPPPSQPQSETAAISAMRGMHGPPPIQKGGPWVTQYVVCPRGSTSGYRWDYVICIWTDVCSTAGALAPVASGTWTSPTASQPCGGSGWSRPRDRAPGGGAGGASPCTRYRTPTGC